MSVKTIQAMQAIQSITEIQQPVPTSAEDTAEKVASMAFPITSPQGAIFTPQTPPKKTRNSSFGSPMGPSITSSEKKRKYGRIMSPHQTHNPHTFDNLHHLGCDMKKHIAKIKRKRNGHTWEVGSPLKCHPTNINPDAKSRIDHNGRRYIVHDSPTTPSPSHASPATVKPLQVRLFPTTGRHLIRQNGEDAANTLIAYRKSGSNESFESYLIRTSMEKARQNPCNQQDLTTTGFDFLSTV